MQEEIEKMSDENLIYNYYKQQRDIQDNGWKLINMYGEELLKRLSKNNIEEYKKKLIEEFKDSLGGIDISGYGYTGKEIEELINNLK